MVYGSNRLASLCPDENHFVSGLHGGNLRHVNHRLVHAHAAHQRRAFPIHKPMTHITVVVQDREA